MDRTVRVLGLRVATSALPGVVRAPLRLAALVLVLAENQRAVGMSLQEEGVTETIINPHMVTPGEISRRIDSLLKDPRARAKMSANGKRLVDGRGAERVVGILAGTSEQNSRSPLDSVW